MNCSYSEELGQSYIRSPFVEGAALRNLRIKILSVSIHIHVLLIHNTATEAGFNQTRNLAGDKSDQSSRPDMLRFVDVCGLSGSPHIVAKDPVFPFISLMTNLSGIVDNIYRECHIFQTENGCLGVGPKAIAKGDMVCVLFGSHSPVVLR